MKREHPIKILRYCALNLWLLLFPLLRSFALIPLSPEAIAIWIRGAWMDIVIMLFIFGFAFVRWFMCRFCFNDEYFILIHGIIFQKHIVIPFEKITAISGSNIKLPLIVRLSLFKINTSAGKASGKIILWLKEKDLKELSQKIPLCKKGKPAFFSYSINLWTIILYSFLFSSSISGTLYIAAFFIEAGNAAGKILSELHIAKALSEMSSAAASVFMAVPEIIILILIILILCRLLSFIINLINYAGFHSAVSKNGVQISSGFFPKRKASIYFSKTECLILKQGFLSRFLEKASLLVTYPSCNKDKQTLIVPIISQKSASIPIFSKFHNKTISNSKALWCFLWQPFTLIGIILALLLIVSYTKSNACEILFPLSGIALVPAAAFLLIRLIAFRIQFVSQKDKGITFCYSKGLSFFTVNTDKQNIAVVKLIRTPMAKKQHYCNAAIYLKGGLKVMLRGHSE